MAGFSITDAIKFGFSKTKTHWKVYIPVLLVAWVINQGPGVIKFAQKSAGYTDMQVGLSALIISFIFWILQTIISIGLIKIALKTNDGKSAHFEDLFKYHSYRLILNYILGTILYGLIILGGLVLLIIPGIIWAIKFQFYGYLIVDKGLGPVEALKTSWEITKGVKLNLFLFALMLGLINILGTMALLIGLFISVPTSIIALAHIYRKLEK